VNAGPDQTICSGNTVTLAGSVGGSATGGTWSGGTGTFAPNANALNATYTPSAAERTAGTVTLTLTSTGPCTTATDNVTITINPAATVNAGPDQTICAGNSVNLAGSVGGSATGGTWSGGAGTFAPNANTLNATYTPSAAEVTAGTVTLTLTTSGPCAVVTDNITITINPAATVNAGPDQTICSGNTVTLAGSVGGSATGGTWSGGTGTFAPNASTLNATYTPSAAERAAGTVTLTLTTTGPCAVVTDNITITINPAATVNAGPDQTICAGNTVTLAGTVGGSATGGTWSGGTGTFAPNANTLNATYTPSAAEVTAGTVTLTLTTTGPCAVVTDNITITINPAATVNAGPDQTICAGNSVTLAGTVGGSATGGTWSGGTGTFAPNANTLNATYTPSAAEVTAGTVTLTLTTTGPCAVVTDNITITINPAATVNAGPDQTICSGNTVTLAGTVGGSATGGTWSGGTGTFTPDANTLTATYTPSAAEVAAGTVTLTLTSTGPCTTATDNMTITINPVATVNAGPDQTICAGNTVTLAGTVGGSATGGTWSGGTGTFAPNANTLNAAYTPSAAEVTAGTVTLTLTTTGPCAVVTDNITITINPAATVNAGPDQTICSGNTVTLAGSVGGSATGGTWSGGTGTFTPDANTLTATYTPSAAEVAAGTVTLTLTSTGPCTTATDNVTITINPAATVNAGPDQTICAGNSVTLAGTVGGSATGGTWSGGTGTFTPDANTLTATYTPSAAEVTAGTVTLTLTTTGPCAVVTDNITITINPAATVNAGADQTICEGSAVTLAGSVGGSATGGTWSGGTGTFAPDANTLTATYTPSAAEIAAGSVTLSLTSTGPCAVVTDNITITINPAAIANAGADQLICAGGTVTLNGTLGGSATSGTWSGGTGTFAPDANTLNAVYTPSAAEVTAGTVTLTLTTDDPDGAGPCAAGVDNITITISSGASVDAGTPQTVCANGKATLNGTFSGASGVTWTTSGDGSFSDPTLTSALYTPGAADIAAGTVTLTLTTGGPCVPVSDNVVLTIVPAATVDAGTPQTVCAGSTITLAASFTGSATGILWTTAGDGTFSDNTDVNAIYTPGTNDITNGSVVLTVQATGTCSGITDNVTITINPQATVNAGSDVSTCAAEPVTLNGSFGGSATSITWTTAGDGTFNNANTPAAIYTPGTNDIAAGSVVLTLTTNNPAGPCPAASDNVTVTISPIAGDPTIFGNDTWIGYVYNDKSLPSPPSSNIDFAVSKYRGFITDTEIATLGFSNYNTATDAFELNLSNNIPLAGANICGSYLNDFSVRYRMRKTFAAGIYTFTVGSDDGVRLLVDGSNVLPAGAFSPHSYNTNSATVCLTAGSHDLVIEYFEHTGFSRLTFDYITAPQPSASPATVCINSAAPTLQASSSDPNVVTFKWYSDAALTNQVGSGANFTPAVGSGVGQLDLSIPGTTNYFVTAVYNCGETAATTVAVDVVNQATITAPNAQVCKTGGIIDLTTLVSAVPSPGSFTFTGTGVTTSPSFDPSLVTGSTNIKVDYLSALGGCAATKNFTIDVINSATITVPASPITICQSAGVQDLTTLVSATPVGGTFTFSGTGVTGSNFDPSTLTGSITINVGYNVGGPSGCSDAKTITFNVVANPAITVTNTSVCPSGGTLNLLTLVNATPTGGTFSFTGTGVSGNSFDPTGLAGQTINVNVSYNVAGCATATSTLVITVRNAADPTCTGGGGSDCTNFSSITPTIVTQPSCSDRDAGVVQFNIARADGTSTTFRVTWTYNSTSQVKFTSNSTTFNDLKSGLYQYTIKDEGNGKVCGPVDFFLDLKTQVHILDKQVTNNVTCFGGSDGNVKLTVDGTTTGQYWYKYVLQGVESPAQTFTPGAPLPGGLPADDTDFIILKVDESAAFSCPDTVMVRIKHAFPQIKTDNPVVTNVTSCNGTDGTITVKNITGGNTTSAPLQIRLLEQVDIALDVNDGLQDGYIEVFPYEDVAGGTKQYTGLTQGLYIVSVKDQTDCVYTSGLIAVQAPGQIPLSAIKIEGITFATCANNGLSGSIVMSITTPGTYQVAISQDQSNVPADDQFQNYGGTDFTFSSLAKGRYYIYVKSASVPCPTRTQAIDIDGVNALEKFTVTSSCDNVNLSITNLSGQDNTPFVIRVFRNSDPFFKIDSVSASSVSTPAFFIYDQGPPAKHDFLIAPDSYRFVMIQTQTIGAGTCTLVSDTVVFNVKQSLGITVGVVKPSFPEPKRTGSIEMETIAGGTPFVDTDNSLYYEARLIASLDNVVVVDWTKITRNAQGKFYKEFQFLLPGNYRIEVRDGAGCQKVINVEVPLDGSIFIPNIFTPNNDNVNDLFEIINLPATGKHKLIISNRWGNEVFASSDYKEGNFWTAEGASEGIYFYRLQVEGDKVYTGWVEIVRGTKP
jgi:gliding motility-associated-like protein